MPEFVVVHKPALGLVVDWMLDTVLHSTPIVPWSNLPVVLMQEAVGRWRIDLVDSNYPYC